MEKLKKLRRKKGYTGAEIARRCGISKSFYWQIENDDRRLSYDLAFKIAEIFETTPDKIFYEDMKFHGNSVLEKRGII